MASDGDLQLFRLLAETAPVLVWMSSADGRCAYFNKQWLEFTGRRLEQELGEGWAEGVHPEDRPACLAEYRRAVEERRAFTLEYRLRRRDGAYRWLLDNGVPRYGPDGAFAGHVGSCVDVTDRVEAAAASARANEDRFRQFVENTSLVWWFVKPDFSQVLYVSPAYEKVFGRPRAGVYQDAWDWVGAIHPDDRAEALERLPEVLAGPYVSESRVARPDGEVRWIRSHTVPIREAGGEVSVLAGVTEDVTDRKKAEERAGLMQLAVEAAGVEIYRLSAEGRIEDANAQACKALGYTLEEIRALAIPQIAPDYDMGRWEADWRELREKGVVHTRLRHRTKDGRRYDAEATGNYFEIDGKGFALVVARDVTERLRAEAERRRLEERLKHADRMESLGLLAGGIAHDFNNLLGAIMGHAGLAALDLPEGSPARESLSEIETAARRAADLTGQMLAYSGRGRFRLEPVDLSELARGAAPALRLSLPSGAALRCEPAEGGARVEGDAAQLHQVLANLVANASDAIGAGRGEIVVRTGVFDADRAHLAGAVLDDGLPEGKYAFLEVADTGAGMDEVTRTKIFDPFFSTKFTGRGLGLASVLGVVRAHRGAIRVESEPGRGSTFRVLIPAIGSAAAAETAPRARPTAGGLILVVDDDRAVGTMARRALEHYGFRTLGADGGEEAVAVYRSRADEIDLVLLDVVMPGVGGAEALARILAIRPEARVALTSGYHEQEALAGVSGLPAAGFVQKPYTPRELAAAVREILAR